jgi:hypothetical protein
MGQAFESGFFIPICLYGRLEAHSSSSVIFNRLKENSL